MTRPRVVTIFTKPECGLCEEAEEVIEAVRARRPFELERRNILEDFEIYERYKHEIPVILVDGIEIARHHLSEEVLVEALNAPPSPLAGEGGGEGEARGVELRRFAESSIADLRNKPATLHTVPPHPNPLPRGERGPEKDIAVVVMAKHPTPGRVKTRLMPALTGEQAAGVQRTFLLHVIGRLKDRRQVIACFDPPQSEAAMRELLDVELVPQADGDLGDRLAAAAEDVRRTSENILFLGVDSPDVPLACVDRVVALLASHDVVVAPADDGGYWAVALAARVDAAKLFAGIEWSSGRECAQTLERAKNLGYNVAVADRWADVDRPADLRRLLERLRRSDDPGDRELLRRLDFLPPLDGVV